METLRSIYITFPDASHQAGKLRDCSSDLEHVEKQLSALVADLQQGWGGEAASAFAQKCGTLQKKLNTTSRDLRTISDTINKSAKAYYDAEKRAIEIAQTRDSGGGMGGR